MAEAGGARSERHEVGELTGPTGEPGATGGCEAIRAEIRCVPNGTTVAAAFRQTAQEQEQKWDRVGGWR